MTFSRYTKKSSHSFVKLILMTVSLMIAVFSSKESYATPAQVIIIRHGEKPADDAPNANELNQLGCARANALPRFFIENSIANTFGPPAALFAQRPKKAGGSLRPIQTLVPTAIKFNLPILDPYVREDISSLTHEIMTASALNEKTVVISWEHKIIPDIAKAFGAPVSEEQSNWPGNVFDQAWVIRFSNNGASSLNIVAENVLNGDNPNGGNQWTRGSTAQVPPELVSICQNNNLINEALVRIVNPSLAAFFFTAPTIQLPGAPSRQHGSSQVQE